MRKISVISDSVENDDSIALVQTIELSGFPEGDELVPCLFNDFVSALGALLVGHYTPENAEEAFTRVAVPQILGLIERSKTGENEVFSGQKGVSAEMQIMNSIAGLKSGGKEGH